MQIWFFDYSLIVFILIQKVEIMTCGEGRHILYCNNSATIALLSSIGEKGFQEKIILNRIN